MNAVTLALSDLATLALSSATSDLISASEFLSSSLHARRLAMAEAVKERDTVLLRILFLAGELLLEKLNKIHYQKL